MAVTSGTVTTNVSGKSHFYVNWSQVSQSIANNQTTINWTAGLYTGTPSSHDSFYSNAVKIYSVYIDGVLVSNGGTWSNIKTSGNHDLLSGTIVIQHSSDGSKSFNISISAWTYPSSSYSGNDWFLLNSIPRQATLTNATDFTDEQNPTIYYSNPAGNVVDELVASILDVNGLTPYADYRAVSKTGSSYTFPLTDAERNALRQACSGNSMVVRFYLRTTIGGVVYYSYIERTMVIVNANPRIDDIQYLDTNTTTTDLTNDDQIIIQNLSTLQFKLYDIAAYKGAALSSLSVNINGNVKTTAYSGTSIVSATYNYNEVDVSSDTNAVVTITDSRGNSASYNVPLTIWEYSQPTAIINVSRENNFYTESHLIVDAKYSSLDNLNSIDIKYRIKKSSDSTWGNWQSISDNVQVDFNADNQYAWDLQVSLEDILGTVNNYTINNALDVGTPLVFYDMLNRRVGINCFPVNGSFEVDGVDISNTYSTTEKVVGTWIDSKPIYRKTIVYTGTALPSGITNIQHNISNIGTHRVIVASEFWYNNNMWNGVITPTSYCTVNAVHSNSIDVSVSNDFTGLFSPVYITLEYTKTTD